VHRGEAQRVTAQDGFLLLRTRARRSPAQRTSKPPSSGRNVEACRCWRGQHALHAD
jgi:hypothetical protein